MLRVCVIGMGPIGNRHADIYCEDELSELVGVCDIIPQRADAAAQRLVADPAPTGISDKGRRFTTPVRCLRN
jgi:predicted dehydrogenase